MSGRAASGKRALGKDPPPRRGVVSEALLAWVVPPLVKGYSQPLEEEDPPRLQSHVRCGWLSAQAAGLWRQESSRGRPSLWRVVVGLGRRELAIGCTSGLLQGLLNVVLRPLMLRLLIQVTMAGGWSTGGNLGLLALFSAVLFLEGVCNTQARHLLGEDLGTKFVGGITSLVQRKAALISSTTHSESDESVLVGTDVVRTFESFFMFSQAPSFFSGIVAGTVLLITLTGVPGLVGLAVMFLLLQSNLQMAKVTKRLEAETFSAADGRMTLMKQLVAGIKAIKFMAWEDQYLNAVNDARAIEIGFIRKCRLCRALTANIGRANPAISACGCFIFLSFLRSEALTPEDVFATIAIFQSLRMPLIMIPLLLTVHAQMRVSFGRIERYLSLPEAPPNQLLPEGSPLAIRVEDASFSWSGSQQPVLAGVCLSLPRGTLTAVVGTVGSGKTSLLMGLLGEMPRTGSVEIAKSVAFIPQKPFVLSGTLRDNVLMGRPWDAEMYQKALDASQLLADLALMSDGDGTEIGERGTTLSGGQQQRLSIARALYAQPALLIADDPLSAVDGPVGSAIFEKALLSRARRGATVVMALNQVHLLPQFDRVVHLAGGQVRWQGPYHEMAQGADPAPSPARADVPDAAAAAATAGAVRPPPSATRCGSCWPAAPSARGGEAMELQRVEGEEEAVGALCEIDGRGPGEVEATREPRTPSMVSAKSTLTEAERMQTGAIALSVGVRYVRAMGLRTVAAGLVVCAVAYAAMAGTDLWIARWVGEMQETRSSGGGTDTGFFVGVYVALLLAYLSNMLFATYLFNDGSARAGRSLHGECLSWILHAPLSWFEATPSGRITSRFSADLTMVDMALSDMVDVIVQFSFTIIALLLVICTVMPYVTPVAFAGIVAFYFQYVAVDRSQREVKRFANTALSPMLTNVSELVSARVLVRVMGYGDFFHSRHCEFTDHYSRYNYFSATLLNWGMLCGTMIAFCITTVAAAVILLQAGRLDPSLAALGLTYSYMMPYIFMIFSAVLGMTKRCLTSLERLLEFQSDQVAQEGPWELPGDKQNPALASWPSGAISFKDVTLLYRPGLEPAVREASFDIPAGERVGIVGRTGAGKSSLIVLLFRVREATSGQVLLDGRDVTSVGLQTLRKKMTVVPQEPLLMQGTVRANLDPFGRHSAEELHRALGGAGLPLDLLEADVGAGGRRISAGEAQLVSFARTLLRRTRLVLMDEPTSSIDAVTDEKVQRMVRSEYSGSTVITIAHRLGTVIDGDRIIVMDAGRVVENGPPEELAADPCSRLSELLDGLGPAHAQGLRERAAMAGRSNGQGGIGPAACGTE